MGRILHTYTTYLADELGDITVPSLGAMERVYRVCETQREERRRA